MTQVHQVYYKPEQAGKLYAWSKPYFNEGLTIFFENDPIVKIVQAATSHKIGVCSWRLADKLRQRIAPSIPFHQAIFETEYDVLALTKQSSKHQMMAAAREWHPGFHAAISLLWEKLGYSMPAETDQPIYQNHYIARTDIYQRYVNEFLQPAMELILKDEELNVLMMVDSNYSKLSNGDMKSVKTKLGLDYYPMCPFVLERCPSLWYTMHGIKVSYV